MAALRLMTFNVQMLPLIPLTIQGQSDDAVERADRVAEAILSIPVAERPDVIAFNEVFNEDGRDRLKTRLGNWPNMVVKIDNGGLDNDSGLMLVSRLPFHNLPTGGVLYEHFYTEAEGDDALACKAVGIVQVNRPAEITTIAFTHLQASYKTEDEYREVRQKQLQEIIDALSAVLGPNTSEWRNVILVGDLNVRGDSGAGTDEWSVTFKTSGRPFQKAFLDGWRSWMHPPDHECDLDRGFTNIDFAKGNLQRLDYHCFSLPGVPSHGAVPHHMFVRLRDQSDHFALEAVIQGWSPRCTPSDAIKLDDISPYTPPPGQPSAGQPTSLRLVDLNFQQQDAFQWIYAKKPGTYTIHKPPHLAVRIFLQKDLSNSISPVDTLSVTSLPPAPQHGLVEVWVDPQGSTFLARLPFFIAVQLKAPDPGPAKLSVFEHLGESPATAIWLTPHTTTPSSFPVGQPLGIDDLCWFKADFPATFAGASRTEKFVFSNTTGSEIEVREFDSSMQELSFVAGSQSSLEVNIATAGSERRLFSLSRASQQATGFTCFWYSPVSYLALDQPLGFFVSNESGPDWAGDDEISLEVFVDGRSLFVGKWDSADTGERWPGFVEAIRARQTAVLPGMRRLPYVDDITLSYVEKDISASSWLTQFFGPLTPADPDILPRRLNLPIPDSISNGLYIFYCSIGRFPE